MARFDIKAWRSSRNGKAYTVRIGSAWTDQKGIQRLSFDALPIPDKDGRVECFLEEARTPGSSDGRTGQYAGDHPAKGLAEQRGSRPADFDDDVSFAPEFR